METLVLVLGECSAERETGMCYWARCGGHQSLAGRQLLKLRVTDFFKVYVPRPVRHYWGEGGKLVTAAG